jgi:surface antigen
VRSGFAARRRRAVTGLAMRWAGPVAAALAIVIVGHQWSLRHAEQALEAREAQIVALADQAVQDALEHALSGAAVSVSDPKMASTVSITPTRTYRSETKHWCREFVEDLVIDGERVTRFGLACRETDGGWRRVQTQQPGSMPPPVSSRTL